jgi:hypothetical protein
MYVKIKKPLRMWSAHRITGILTAFGVSQQSRRKISVVINNSFIGTILHKVHQHRLRGQTKVRIDDFDLWNGDLTLATVILPFLQRYRTNITVTPKVDDQDVPENLRSTSAPALTADEIAIGTVDANYHKRWEWVVDQMIWSFVQIIDDSDSPSASHFWSSAEIEGKDPIRVLGQQVWFDNELYEQHQSRVDNGLALFGKYFRGMWT